MLRAVPALPQDDGEAVGDVARAYAGLRRMILDCRLLPGQTVSQADLVALLGIGRTPIREAVRMLQQEGLMVVETNRRPRVAPFHIRRLLVRCS